MPRVKIKCRSLLIKDKIIKLLEILCSKEVHVTKMFEASDGFAVIALNEDNADRNFVREVVEELMKSGFTANILPELKVKKCVIITRVDDIIYDWKEEDIANEISLKYDWIGDELDTVYKSVR